MKLIEYQKKAMVTCMPSCQNYNYMFGNLVGETGEFSSKVSKAQRKKELHFIDGQIVFDCSGERAAELSHELMLEAGDMLWQLAGLCYVMGWDMDYVAKENLSKLASRQQRGVIDGNGDNR